MRPKILFLGLFLVFCFLFLYGGGGGGSGSNDAIAGKQSNEDKIEENENNESSAKSNFIQVLDENYSLKQVWETELGLPWQIELLPTGDIVVADPNYNRISMITNGTVKVLADGDNVSGITLAVLQDGRVCYSNYSGQLILVDPYSLTKSIFSATPSGEQIVMLATDEYSNVYAVTTNKEILKFDSAGVPVKIAENLPYAFPHAICDLDVAPNGTIYISAPPQVFAVEFNQTAKIVVDDISIEPVFIEVAQNGTVHINSNPSGLQKYDPTTKNLENYKIKGFRPFADILLTNNNEIIFYEWEVYYKYNLLDNTAIALVTIPGNNAAFTVNMDNIAFFATRGKPQILKSHIISLDGNGNHQDLSNLAYEVIYLADINKNNRLCILTDEGYKRVEPDNAITTVNPIFEPGKEPIAIAGFAVGPGGIWYVISLYSDNFQIYSFDDSGKVNFLPIVFDKTSFDKEVYNMHDARIDVSDDGRIAIIVTAAGSFNQGPFYQRVYRAESDGTDLKEIANLDSSRCPGWVDIAVAPNNDVYVLTVHPGSDRVYRIDQNNETSEFLRVDEGNDPQAIDVDHSGAVWITTTKGIFRAEPFSSNKAMPWMPLLLLND